MTEKTINLIGKVIMTVLEYAVDIVKNKKQKKGDENVTSGTSEKK